MVEKEESGFHDEEKPEASSDPGMKEKEKRERGEGEGVK